MQELALSHGDKGIEAGNKCNHELPYPPHLFHGLSGDFSLLSTGKPLPLLLKCRPEARSPLQTCQGWGIAKPKK